MDYDEFLTPLRKYKRPATHQCKGCSLKNGVFEDNVHLLVELGGERKAGSFLLRYYLIKKEWPNACRHGAFNLYKTETGLYKMGGPNIHPLWRDFCYWELGYGYIPYKKPEELVDEVETWLVRDLVLGGPLGEAVYMDLLAEEVRSFMSTEWKMPSKPVSVAEWLKTGKWMEGKAGTGRTTQIHVEGRKMRTSRAKPIDGVHKTDITIDLELRTPVRERMIVMQKSEGGKIRGVVKTSNEINRKMNYLSTWMENGLHGSRLSTLFAGEKGNEEIDFDLIGAARNPGLLKVPLDQGGFDQHQSRESILVVLKEIGLFLEPRVNHKDFSQVWEALWNSLSVLGSSVEIGDFYRGDWGNGLPSGWRWTAILDTILNICSFRVVRRVAACRLGRPFWIGNFYAQGDDVIFTATNKEAIQLIIDSYGQIGYEVHPEKTYISDHRGEFLRRSYEPEGVTGYLARSLGNLRFRTPIQSAPLTPGERLYGLLSQCHLMSLRTADPKACAQYYYEQAVEQGLDGPRAADYALTPSSVGGCGLDPMCAMGAHLSTLSTGGWCTLEIHKELRVVRANFGAWETRFERIGWVPTGRARTKILRALVASWGIRESQVTGEARSEFLPLARVVPLPIPPGDVLPDSAGFWDLDHVPVQLRNPLQRDVIEHGVEAQWIRPEYRGLLLSLRKRMSLRVYTGYLLGEWVNPSPLVDMVGPRYGGRIKKEADAMVHRALGVKDIGLHKLGRYLLGVEYWMRKELRHTGLWALLAQ